MAAIKEKTILNYFLFLFLLSLSLLFLDKFSRIDYLKGFLARFTNPIKAGIYFIYQKTISTDRAQDKHGVAREVLEEKLVQLERETQVLKAETEELRQENQSMRRLLGAPFPPSWQFLPAKIISHKQGEIVIDQGKEAGVWKGQVVIFEKAYVGKVFMTEERNALIQAIYHKEIDLPVRVAGTNVSGKLKILNGQTIVDEVERHKDLSIGDTLVTSGNSRVPAGIVVGEVKGLIDDPTASFQKAQVEPAVNPRELVDVFVVTEF